MAFGLKLRKMPKEEIDRRVEEAAEVLEITEFLGSQAEGVVWWSAAAGGDGSCDCARAEGVLDG